MAEKIGFLDRITNRAAALCALFVGMIALLNNVSDFFGKLGEKWEILQQLPWWSQGAVSVLLAIIAVYLIRTAFAGKSRLLRPERFLIQPDEPRFLKGREREVQELGQLCDREPLVFLDGESGCGKSALVCAGLLPWCEDDPARPLPLRIDLSEAPWDNGIANLLGRNLWIEKGDLCRELDFKQYPQDDAVFRALTEIGARTARAPLLIFDQFDDYQTAYRDQFYPAGGSRLLTSQEFLASNHFWSQVAQGVIAQHWHCLVVTRNDTRAGLDAIRFCDARSYTLWRVEQNLIAPLFDEITAPGSDGTTVVDHPELSWNQLRERLINDLASQEGQILPIQLAVSIDAIRRWRFLTVAQYRTQGGLPGLERLHVQGYVQETAHATGLSVATLIAVLLRLTDPVRKKARRTSFSELVQSLTGVSPDILRQALTTLEERRIVRRVAHAEEAGGEAWLLYHDYLARGVMEAHRASDRWRLLLDEQARAWQRADGWREKWHLLLPLRTQARLAWEILRRRLRIGTYSRYMTWSILRFVPALVIVAAVYWASDWIEFQQELQIAQSTIAALDTNEGVSENEATYFQKLIGTRWQVKQRALQDVLESSDASDRAVKHIDMLIHIAVGLDETGKRSDEVVRMCLQTLASPQSAASSRIFAIKLLTRARISDRKTIAQILLERMKTEQNLAVRTALAQAAPALAAKLEPQAAQTLAQLMLVWMQNEQDLEVRVALAEMVPALVVELEPQAAQILADGLLARLNTEKDSFALHLTVRAVLQIPTAKLKPQSSQTLFDGLLAWMINVGNDLLDAYPTTQTQVVQALAANLEPQAVQALAHDLLARMNNEKDIFLRKRLAQAVETLATMLEPQAAHTLAQGLLERMKTEQGQRLPDYLNQLGVLRVLATKLEPQAVQSLAHSLLERMKAEQNPWALKALAETVQVLPTILEPQDFQTLAHDLLQRMITEQRPSTLQTLAETVQVLPTMLEPQDFQTLADGLLARMNTEKEPAVLNALIQIVQLLPAKLEPQAAQALADRLLLAWTNNGLGRPILAMEVENLAAKLNPQVAQTLAQGLLERMKTEQASPVRRTLAMQVVALLSAKLEPQAVQALTDDLLAWMKTERDSNAFGNYIFQMSRVATKLEPQTAQKLTQDLVARMKTEQDPKVRADLARMVAVTVAKLEPRAAQTLTRDLLERMITEKSPSTLQALAKTVQAFPTILEPKAAQTLAQSLLERMKTEQDPRAFTALDNAVPLALVAKLEPKAAQTLAQGLLERMKTEQDPDVIATLAMKVLVLENQLSIGISPNSPVQLQSYVDLIKGYTCGFIKSRKAILDIIEVKTGQKFDGDKWRFVEWATSKDAAKFHLDLD